MNKSRTFVLKTGLCGLALSSLFLLNNKSVVHADTIDGSQNNAISWNSDSDTAQGVQNTQNTQKADDNQQNAQSVQPSRAETSTVRSVSAAPRTTNQNTVVQSPRVANVQDAEKASPVVINNPAGDKVNVHYVNRDGGAITDPNVKDTTIDVTKTGQGSYSVPNGYSLNNPDGKYTISGGAFNGTNLKGNVEHHQGYDTFMIGDQRLDSLPFGDTDDGTNKFLIDWLSAPYNVNKKNWQYFVTANPSNTMSNGIQFYLLDPATAKEVIENSGYNGGSSFNDLNGNEVYEVMSIVTKLSPEAQPLVNMTTKYVKENPGKYYSSGYKYFIPLTRKTEPTYDVQHLPVAFVDSNNNVVGMVQNYSGKVGTTQNISLTVPTGYKLADGVSLPTSVTFADNDNAQLIKVVPNNIVNKHNVVKAPHAAENANTFTFDTDENRYGHKLENGMLSDDDVSYLYKLFDATDDKPLYLVLSDYSDDDKGTIFSNGELHTMVASKYNSADDAKKLKDICSKIHLGIERATDEVTIGNGVTITPKSLYQSDVMYVKFVDQSTGKEVAGGYDIDLSKAKSGTNYYNIPAGFGTAETMYTVADHASSGSTFVGPRTGSLNEDDTTYILGKNYSGGAFNIYTDEDAGTENIGVTLPNRAVHLKFENGSTYGVDARMKNIWVNKFGFDDPDLGQAVTIVPNSGYYSFMDNYHEINSNTVTVPVHQSTSYMFADNSGNAKSAQGNTVDVTLTKPQNVDPSSDTRCQAQATRTIQINFPDGQVPKSYDGIVDKSGKLVQTVHFTRPATEDALTGNILWYGNWTSDNQDHNFIGFEARTLPRIPGYTLSIKPA